MPRARASAQLKRRTLAARLSALAERHVTELEALAEVDAEKLIEALELLKMAKLAAMGRRRPRKLPKFAVDPRAVERPIMQLCAADVDLSRAPRPAIDDFLDSRAEPPEAEPRPRPRPRKRGRRQTRFTGEEYQRWMREKW